MADHTTESSSDISSLSISVLLCLLLCAGILGYFFTNQKPVDDSAFEFQSIEIDEARLKAERKKRLGSKKVDKNDPRFQGLLTLSRSTNAEQFSTLLSDTEKMQRAAARVHRANEVLEQGWFPAFWAAGEIIVNECNAELKKVVTQVQKGAEEEVFRTGKEFINYREACGDILPVLFSRNILTKRGQWVDKNGPEIVDLTLRYSWGYILADRRHPSLQLTPYEYEIYESWRIANENGFTREERLKFLSRAKRRSKDFPANVMMAKMQFQDGKKDSALRLLEEAQKEKPADPEIGKLIRYLKKK